jgi:hypothetical protein
LSVEAFKALREHFFSPDGKPKSFFLRPKRNTQDDPFDEYLATEVLNDINGVMCIKAPGPLITPDLVLFRQEFDKNVKATDLSDIAKILSIEVKKLERTDQGNVARASGLDYNTTPPCGTVRVYDAKGTTLDIRCFYLFVCLEASATSMDQNQITALTIVDGNVLNEDFNFYLSIVGERTKRIDLGSYGDGADRVRPMLIFPNPLGSEQLDHGISLIHPKDDLDGIIKDLRLILNIERTTTLGEIRHFYCYQHFSDVPADWNVCTIRDPFPTPKRNVKTQSRGCFRLPFKVH